MQLEVQCKGCNARYLLKEEFAGRMARCKHCGVTFRVPYKSRVVALDDEDAVPPEAEQEESQESSESTEESDSPQEERTFEEYGIPLKERAAEKATTRDDAVAPILPPIVAELWMPLSLVVIGFGLSLYIALDRMIHSTGPLAGVLLVAVMVVMYLALIIPMVRRTLESAANTVEFELPNAVWLQTTAALALPTLAGTIGFFGAGFGGLVAGVFIGLALMMPAMLLMYGIDPVKALQAAVLAALFYLMTLAGSAAVVAGIGLLVFPLWNMNVPWREPAPVVAATPAPKAAPVVTDATPAPAPAVALAPAKETAPAEIVAPAPIDDKPKLKWTAVIDAPAQPARWATDLHHVLDVKPPVMVVHAGASNPFVALFDMDSVDTYDLRNGKRLGSIKQRMSPAAALLSPGGKYLLGRALPVGMGTAMQGGQDVPSGNSDIWSTTEGRLLTRLGGGAAGASHVLGFAGPEKIVATAMGGSQAVIQVWDAPSGQLLKSFPGAAGSAWAFSANGKFLATLVPGKLNVFDLEAGELVSEAVAPAAIARVHAISFSNSGALLAAIVNSAGGPTGVLVWDLATGSPRQQFPIATARTDLSADDVRWTPDDAGLAIGTELIDVSSGKPYYHLVPPVAMSAPGAVRAIVSNYHVLYEYLPAGSATRVVYKVAPIPKGELDTAIRSVRGPDWTPPTEVPVIAAVTEAPAGADAAGGAIPLTERVKQKEWTVAVVVVRHTDVAALDQQIRTEQSKLPDLDNRFNQARVYADRMEAEMVTRYDQRGNPVRVKARSNREIGDARVVADRLNEDKHKINQTIARLQRQKKDAETTRTVAGKLDDGTVVTLDCDGAAIVSIADGLVPDSKWKVAGAGRIVDGELHLKPRALTPAE